MDTGYYYFCSHKPQEKVCRVVPPQFSAIPVPDPGLVGFSGAQRSSLLQPNACITTNSMNRCGDCGLHVTPRPSTDSVQ
ncbi:hypothetical protein CSKR_203684 [Clonorchis sinensis]|uniref:Uncharacterized protein n=1 Tax=Clonorchis sinensis TaxID=79923 RepID=A0A8T1N062_CLOSI|nr:hypothetical protein CSKR_203684 [Clonorchis sinensis]